MSFLFKNQNYKMNMPIDQIGGGFILSDLCILKKDNFINGLKTVRKKGRISI